MANEFNGLQNSGEIVLAQAQTDQTGQQPNQNDNTQPPATQNADVPPQDSISKPAAGEQVTVPVTANERIAVEFNPDDAQIVEQGDNLTFIFSDGSSIVLAGFVALSLSDAPPAFVLSDGTVLAGNVVVASLRGVAPQDLEPAAGDTPTGSGSTVYSDNFGNLIDGLRAQGPLPGEGFPRFTPTLDDPTEPLPSETAAITGPTITVGIVGDPNDPNIVNPDPIPDLPPLANGAIRLQSAGVVEGTDSGTPRIVTFVFTLSEEVSDAVEITYVVNSGTATVGDDVFAVDPLSGTVIIPAGETTVTVQVEINQDHFVEGDENFTLTVTNVVNATVDPAHDTATVTIIDDDHLPAAADDVVNVQEDSLDNPVSPTEPTDPDGEVLTITVTGLPDAAKGVVTLADGTPVNVGDALTVAQFNALQYDTVADANGAGGVMTYTVSDGFNAPADGTVTFNIEGVNDRPLATDNLNSITEDDVAPAVGNMIVDDDGFGVDSDPDNDDLDVAQMQFGATVDATGTIAGAYGTLTWDAETGAYSYALDNGNPAVQALGLDAGGSPETLTEVFTYTATDGNGGTDTATLTITINGQNDVEFDVSGGADVYESGLADGSHVPAAQPITDGGDLNINADTVTLGYSITAGGQTINSGTVDTIVIEDAQGRLTIFANGTYSYTLLDNFDHSSGDIVPVAFDITVTDINGLSATETLTVDVHDDAPIALDDADKVQSGGVTQGNVLTGIDPDADASSQGTQVADVAGADNPAAISTISNGTDTSAVGNAGTTIAGQYGSLTIFTDGSYQYQAFDDTDPTDFGPKIDVFTYTMGDTDGDGATANLSIAVKDGVLVIGSQDADVNGSNSPHTVPNPFGATQGEIRGEDTADILVGDVGGSTNETRDANIILILDTSGSMTANIPFDGGTISRLQALKNAVNAMLDDLAGSTTGTIRIHFVEFGTALKSEATFDITDGDLAAAHAYINALTADGFTNYEAGLQGAIDWVDDGNALAGADVVNQVLFVSDGLPNYGLEEFIVGPNAGQNNPFAPEWRDDAAINEILGIDPAGPDNGDGTNEVAILEGMFGPIEAVGINVDVDPLAVLDVVEGEPAYSGAADNITTAEQLADVLSGLNPLLTLADASGDYIDGGAGNDLIFGDVLYTDDLATAEGLGTLPGSGWAVFAQLEAGAGNDSTYGDWSRARTIQYIEDNAEQLAQESNINGQVRGGGDDIILGGAGNDWIFAQEGDDMITGGSGDDMLWGGSGDDTFVYTDTLDGNDLISDFVAGQDIVDLDALLDSLGFVDGSGARAGAVNVAEVAGDTVLTVNNTGATEVAGFSITIEGVTGMIVGTDIKTDDSGLA